MTDTSKHGTPEDLSVSEKILRVQDLWDEIARSPENVEVTPAQLEELERRLQKHDRDPGNYATWEEIRRELEDRQ